MASTDAVSAYFFSPVNHPCSAATSSGWEYARASYDHNATAAAFPNAIGSPVRGGTGSTPAAGGFGVADGVVEGAALGEADVVAEGGAGGLAADRESRVR
jgi:hypothetical protein